MGMNENAMPSLRAVFHGARCFGLSDVEAWHAVDQCLLEVGPEATMDEYLDVLTDRLARGVLAKQRGEAQAGFVDRRA
jgi:hypothetical protein